VRPAHPENVGAAARVVRNMGLGGLDLVEPGDWRTLECWRTAWGAQDVLEEARVFGALPPALAGAALTIAFSGRRGDGVPARDVREAAQEVAALPAEQWASLVFGPEASGLTLAEMAACGQRAFIPSDPAQPSLNLSHAVMVAAYEVFRARRPPASETGPQRATADEKGELLALLRAGLPAIGALPPDRPDEAFEEWTRLVQRLDLTRRELRLLAHMARRLRRGEGA
jgi:TrmH family RNA methyltransferase